MHKIVRFPAVAAALILPLMTFAFVERPQHRDPRTLEGPRAGHRVEPLDPNGTTPASGAAGRFLLRHGGAWTFQVDPRSGRAVMVQGSGIPVVPGRGNGLAPAVLTGLSRPDGEITLETLEPQARALIEEHAALLAPDNGRLELDRRVSLVRDAGRHVTLHYRWLVDDVPVERARVFVRVNNGNVVQLGAPFIGRAEIDTQPAFDADAAVRSLLEWSGDAELFRLHDEPRLVIQPEDDGAALAYRLIWIVSYQVPGDIATWEGRLDARSGQVVGFRDITAYGQARGGIYPRTVTDTEIVVPFPLLRIEGETPVTTDTAGSFGYTGGEISSGLDGAFFTTNCSDGCANPAQAISSTDLGSGLIDFGSGGVDQTGNGISTRAERNAFFHMNQVRRIAKKWLDFPWLDSTILANVNILDTCNAGWNGTANFFRSGGGCNNTGEISDVMQHEWGHGLDGNTNGGDGATGEGTADVTAMHMTHSPLIGPYFNVGGSPVRNVDKDDPGSRGLLTASNFTGKCPAGSVHCEGEIYGQTQWDLSQALVLKHGHHTGWRASERIFFTSLPDADTYKSAGPQSIYDAYMAADDDNGNLNDGTPNGQEIFAAFDTHEIAGVAHGSSATCTRPTQPVLSVTPACGQVDLSWGAVAGIDHYSVFRAELVEDSPFFFLADVAAGQTTYTDSEVGTGVNYYYMVMSVAADGCESTIENPPAATLDPQAVLSATAAVTSDIPQGNRSGFADPDEEVDVTVTLGNFGDLAATSIVATLSSADPAVTILDGVDTFAAVGPGGQAPNDTILRFVTDGVQISCGDRLRFELSVDSPAGCAAASSFFDVVLGDRAAVFVDAFEADNGWTLDAVNSTAVTGDWIRGDPVGTGFQPEDDVSDPGTDCFYTAANPGAAAGTDDVDDGVTILLSPIIDLSGMTQAVLSYYRWFNNRDLGEDAGDFFQVDVSDDAGGSWVNLETLDSSQSAPSWTRREFKLQDLVALTNQIQLRFQAADGVATGNLIEAAIDELRIEEPVCDDTPACFTEPTFAGLTSAVAGNSCAEAGLSWGTASTNCQNATIVYNVYRSQDPAFMPAAENLIAQGLTGTSFTDSLLDPGASYHYIVRADDSRSGEDTNLNRQSVVAPSSPDLQAPVFFGLSGASPGVNCGETVLSWGAAQESCSGPVAYQVYRSTDAGFTPAPSNRIGSTLSLGLTDAALVPGTVYTYVVRARDELGNEDANDIRFSVDSGLLDAQLATVDFEPGDQGWVVASPNDATTGNWERGNPQGTEFQPEDDFTADPGVNAWITGLAAAGGGGGNDIDGGTTTLLSASYDLSTAIDPVVRYARWFTNDQGGAPAEDPFDVEVTGDGQNWVQLEQINGGTPLAWVPVEFSLTGLIAPTATMQFRFTARDTGSGGSLVEAGVDEFELIDVGQGCSGCTTPVATVDRLRVDRSGDDIVVDWTADPTPGVRFAIYQLTGAGFGDAVRIGTAGTKSFVHEGAALSSTGFSYRVTAIDPCGNESALQ